MAIQPAFANVHPLPDRADAETEAVELLRALDTQRSGASAVLAALRDMEAMLEVERHSVQQLTVQRDELQETLSGGQRELDRQRKVTTTLFAQLEEARAALADERSRTLLDRLLRR